MTQAKKVCYHRVIALEDSPLADKLRSLRFFPFFIFILIFILFFRFDVHFRLPSGSDRREKVEKFEGDQQHLSEFGDNEPVGGRIAAVEEPAKPKRIATLAKIRASSMPAAAPATPSAIVDGATSENVGHVKVEDLRNRGRKAGTRTVEVVEEDPVDPFALPPPLSPAPSGSESESAASANNQVKSRDRRGGKERQQGGGETEGFVSYEDLRKRNRQEQFPDGYPSDRH